MPGDSKTLSNFPDQAEMFRPNDRKVSELDPVIKQYNKLSFSQLEC